MQFLWKVFVLKLLLCQWFKECRVELEWWLFLLLRVGGLSKISRLRIENKFGNCRIRSIIKPFVKDLHQSVQ